MTRTVYGIDWSGAKKAGKHIWIADGTAQLGGFQLAALTRGDTLSGGSVEREDCYAGLRAWLQTLPSAIVGFDFPFSLPLALLPPGTWSGFIDEFAARFPDSEAFRAWCLATANGRELKRRTDRITRTPFSAYNLRMYRQTYWGFRLLADLRAAPRNNCRALPLERAAPSKTWLIETCPASVLKSLDQYCSYKGTTTEHRRARGQILRVLEAKRLLSGVTPRLRRVMKDDVGGDALDAALAGLGAARAVQHPHFPKIEWHGDYAREACVYI